MRTKRRQTRQLQNSRKGKKQQRSKERERLNFLKAFRSDSLFKKEYI